MNIPKLSDEAWKNPEMRDTMVRALSPETQKFLGTLEIIGMLDAIDEATEGHVVDTPARSALVDSLPDDATITSMLLSDGLV